MLRAPTRQSYGRLLCINCFWVDLGTVGGASPDFGVRTT
jgi:hypothetical protein